MNCKWSPIDLGWRSGTIYEMCSDAIEVAKLLNTRVVFTFNGVRVNVGSRSDVEDVSLQTMQAVKNSIETVFGG